MEKKRQNQTQSNIVQFMTFFLGKEMFGVNTLHVQEILVYQKMTSVPCAPDYVKGLLNLRGQILTVIDMRSRLGMEKLVNEAVGMNLIITSHEGPISLFVDNIGNVVDIPADRLLPPPGTIRGVTVKYIQEVCQLDESLLIVLNLENILEVVK